MRSIIGLAFRPFFLGLLGIGLVVACAPSAPPSPTAAPTAAPAAKAEAPAKPAATPAQARFETLDELYEKAKREGGTLVFYGTLAQVNAEKLLPAFEKRFPGIKVEHVDATGDKLVARAVAEARGGKVLADVFNSDIQYVARLYDQKLLMEMPALPPESAAYPENLKGTWWNATDFVIMLGAWNTNQVKKEEEPKGWEDFADPRWKGRLIGEPRDLEILLGLAKYKYRSDDRAVEVLRRIAANNPEFHDGHSQLAELLVAGQAAACFTCYSHHYPTRMQRGAPVNYWLTEGVAQVNGGGILKDAPHPNTAMLWHRWLISEEGQKAMAEAGRTPAHPKVEPLQKTRPERVYAISVDDLKEYSKYERMWKEIFQLR